MAANRLVDVVLGVGVKVAAGLGEAEGVKL
jgi:hypothetical protein